MAENNKSYRIRTNVNPTSTFYLNVNINQDYKNLEILSLSLDSNSLYKMYTSEYGCVVGRVLANNAMGIPNAKISVFIPTQETDEVNPILRSLYPYESTLDKNEENIRYNTLPDENVTECHQAVGTFPNKRLVLDDNNVLEIFDKYYKYTTVSNASGDYMIYGVPVGEHTIHVDIDLSDIGELSQRPIDMMYKGYDKTQFESSSMFNKSTDLDKLTQIFSQNQQVYVKPFWGNDEAQNVSITRCDISIQYKFEPTCIFIGSIITDSTYAGFSKRCIPSPEMGRMANLVGTSGTIEIIRKTQGNNVESLVLQGTQLIDGSGRWCFQIPMNLDYVGTDEYGNKIAINDPNKGVPTRTRVRFRISSSDEHDQYNDLHITKVLVPHNPKTMKDIDYAFGSKTLDNDEGSLSFRDLFKDNVYTVKSYIPRIQRSAVPNRTEKFSGIKNVTDNNGNNSIPYNNMRVNITFMFILQCAILKMMIFVVSWINSLLSSNFWYVLYELVFLNKHEILKENQMNWLSCITIGDALCPDMEGWYFAPGCDNEVGHSLTLTTGYTWSDPYPNHTALQRTCELKKWAQENNVEDKRSIDFGNSPDSSSYCLTNNLDYFLQCVEVNLAMEHNVIQFDFYNDWLNGTIYLPKWFGTIRKKRSYFFGLIRRPEKIMACMEETSNYTRRLVQQCALTYVKNDNGVYNVITSKYGCNDTLPKQQGCHKRNGRKSVKILGTNGGVVHKEETIKLDNVYYLRPMEMYDKRLIFLFATDIVLLGSINPNNSYGIPYVFNGLTGSSYKFPTLLAMTNLGEDSTQYTACSNDGNGGQIDPSGVTTTYNQPKEGEDAYDNSPYDNPQEFMYTEYAGVDWGYIGPGQGKENKLDTLYFPGGHFLGISCFNSEANIKSCVNLSRACEIGTSFSQFTEVPTGVTDDKIQYKQYNPNGLISKREITDSPYRNIFATLNFNELKTIANKETLQRENNFISNFSFNFDGVLSDEVSNTDYTSRRTLETIDPSNTNKSFAYGSSFEDNDIDYYKFRFGTYRGPYRECFAGHANDNNEEVYLPIYNNSFYFYFGIKESETAYDKLYEDYYSVCTNENNTIPSIEVNNIINNDFCETNGGSAMIEISQLSSIYNLYFDYKASDGSSYQPCKLSDFKFEDGIPTVSPKYIEDSSGVTTEYEVDNSGETVDSVSVAYKKFLFKNLLNGDYIIYARMLNDSYEYKAHFTIKTNDLRENPVTKEILDSISVVDFAYDVNSAQDRNSGNTSDNGYIEITHKKSYDTIIDGYEIITSDYKTICSYGTTETGGTTEGLSGYTEVTEDDDNGEINLKFYVPSGDAIYYLVIKLKCYENKTELIRVDRNLIVYYRMSFDYYFTNSSMIGKILRECLTGNIGMSSLNKLESEPNKPWYINENLYKLPTYTNDIYKEVDYERFGYLEYAMVYDRSLFEVLFNHDFDEREQLNVGFITYDRQGFNYGIEGNKSERTFSSGGIGLDIFGVSQIEKSASESIMSWVQNLSIYIPTSRILSTTGTTFDGTGTTRELSVSNDFSDYFKKLISITLYRNVNHQYILEYNDQNMLNGNYIDAYLKNAIKDYNLVSVVTDENNEINNE